MPIDKNGVRADVVMDGGATVSRMNLGRLYEHYYNSVIITANKNLKSILGMNSANVTISPETLRTYPTELIDTTWNFLLGLYEKVNPDMFEYFNTKITIDEKYEHLAHCLNTSIKLCVPIDTKVDAIEVIKDIEQSPYKPLYDKVTYIGNSGVRCETESNIRIAPLYLMLLEKIADDGNSVATAKLQHFGILSTMTKSEKFSNPYRNTPVRTIGETEGRIYSGYCGRRAIAEMMDRSNNPLTQRNMVWNILSADKPTNIPEVVNRDMIPLGGSKPLQLISHMFKAAGFEFVYEPEDTK